MSLFSFLSCQVVSGWQLLLFLRKVHSYAKNCTIKIDFHQNCLISSGKQLFEFVAKFLLLIREHQSFIGLLSMILNFVQAPKTCHSTTISMHWFQHANQLFRVILSPPDTFFINVKFSRSCMNSNCLHPLNNHQFKSSSVAS